MKNIISRALFAILGFAFAATAIAATCPTGAKTSCSANQLCGVITQPTTRESGAALATGEIAGYQLSINGALVASPSTAIFSYMVPTDTTMAAGSTISAVTVDTGGLTSSTAFTCTLGASITGKKSSPSAPVGLILQ